jgi:hypothetical protein
MGGAGRITSGGRRRVRSRSDGVFQIGMCSDTLSHRNDAQVIILSFPSCRVNDDIDSAVEYA